MYHCLSVCLSVCQVTIEANGMSIQCPHQLLINGEFVNSSWGRTYNTINPTNETVSYYCTILLLLMSTVGHMYCGVFF